MPYAAGRALGSFNGMLFPNGRCQICSQHVIAAALGRATFALSFQGTHWLAVPVQKNGGPKSCELGAASHNQHEHALQRCTVSDACGVV
jgi:hypothetical protein